MALSRNEEIIYREVEALAGDLGQIAENITRDHMERLKEAKEREEVVKVPPGVPRPGISMRGFDKGGLLKDLGFIQTRLNALVNYIEG